MWFLCTLSLITLPPVFLVKEECAHMDLVVYADPMVTLMMP